MFTIYPILLIVTISAALVSCQTTTFAPSTTTLPALAPLPTNFADLIFPPRGIEFPSSRSIWNCPSSCGPAADSWCQAKFGLGGVVVSENCVHDETTGLVSFECRCNNGGAPSVTPGVSEASNIQIVARVEPTTSTTTLSSTMTSTTTTSTSETVPSSTSSSSSFSPTTTTTTVKLIIDSSSKICHVAPRTKAYFQESPFGMFCRPATGTCPTVCAKLVDILSSATSGGSATSSGATSSLYGSTAGLYDEKEINQKTNPTLIPFLENCQGGHITCVKIGEDKIVTTCSSCNSGNYIITTILNLTTTAAPPPGTTAVEGGGGGGGVANTPAPTPSQFEGIASCRHEVGFATLARAQQQPTVNNSVVVTDVAPEGACSSQAVCSGHGCCSKLTQCTCFGDRILGFYTGSTCSSCAELYVVDAIFKRCILQISPILRLLNLLGSRPSAILAPVSVIAAFVIMVIFFFRTRWQSDQERYVVPPGISLVDPSTGYSISPNARFYIPPRPTASRGIVNQRLNEERMAKAGKRRK